MQWLKTGLMVSVSEWMIIRMTERSKATSSALPGANKPVGNERPSISNEADG